MPIDPLPAVHVGCCGWRVGRARYYEQFSCVELQDPFYQMPTPALAAKRRLDAPADFQFCLKAWQLITHTPASPTYRRLKSKVSPLEAEFYGAFRPTEQVWFAWEQTAAVGRALNASVILFQCPASFRPSLENVRNFREFFGGIHRSNSRIAWEPRGDWPADLVKDLCAEFDLIHCVDPFSGTSVTGNGVYWRLHGRGGYSYVYLDEELDWLRDETLRRLESGSGPVFVFFNNLAMHADAVRFKQRLGF